MAKSQLLLLIAAFLLFAGLVQTISAVHLYDETDSTINTGGGGSSSSTTSNATDFIRTSCSATLYPDRCYSSLARYASAIQQSPSQLALVAVSVGLRKARRTASYMASIARAAAGSGSADERALGALEDCRSTFSDAVDLIRQSQAELRLLKRGGGSFRWHMSNVETWLSAALTNEDTCTDGFEEVAPGPLKDDVCARVASAKEVTSNALALVNSLDAKEGGEDADLKVGRGF